MNTYESSGVSLARGDAASEDAKLQITKTFNANVVLDQGIPGIRLKNLFPELQSDPILTQSTDGVGTKLMYAAAASRFNTIGRDVVAMVLDDVARYNRRPLGFSLYRAANRIVRQNFSAIVEGAVEGCIEAGVPYLSGETAEMPGFYRKRNVELAGFADCIHAFGSLRFGQDTKPRDLLIGLSSDEGGSNGFSFLRKIWSPEDVVAGRCPVTIDEVLKPTPIYTQQVLEVMKQCSTIRGWAHITGGGLGEKGKLAALIPEGLTAFLDTSKWQVPKIFQLAREESGATDTEMFSTFNMGLMMIAPVESSEVHKAIEILEDLGCQPRIVGYVAEKFGDSKIAYI